MRKFRTGVFFILIVSLIIPHPAIIAAQDPQQTASEPSAVTNDTTPVPANDNANANATEQSLPESSEATENQGKNQKPPKDNEEPIISSLSETQDPDPEYGDERAPRVRQPVVEADQLDGSLRYLHPLTIPQGRNSLEPDLALVYSSRPDEQTSLFGYGWSINIPYIERVNRYGVDQLYTTDIFYASLDGELASTTGASTIYGAKVENGDFRKYELVDDTHWEVTDKHGTIYTFGEATSSKQFDVDESTHIFRWMLEEVRDRNDNYISYQYYKDASNQIYPYQITYTGSGATPGILTIDFIRESRSDIATSSKAGFQIGSRQRIDRIDVTVNGSWVRQYDFSYTNGDNGGRSMVSSITETGRDEQSATLALPASTVAYKTSNDSWSSSNWHPPVAFIGNWASRNARDNGARIADFNGDGLPDIMRYRESAPDSEANQKLLINNGDGTWATTSPSGMQAFVNFYGDDLGVRVADMNGDGLPDLIDENSQPVLLNSGNGASFVRSSNWGPLVDEFVDSAGLDTGLRIVDLNGDGLADQVRAFHSTSTTAIYFNTGSGWREAEDWSFPVPFVVNCCLLNAIDNGVRMDDFNGDGLIDVMHGREGGLGDLKLYFNNGDGTWATTTPSGIDYFVSQSGVDTGNRIGDMNGDGLPDIIRDRTLDPIYLNTGAGTSFVQDTSFPAQPYDFIDPSGCCFDLGTRLADMNGDGMIDFIRARLLNTSGVSLKQGDVPDLLTQATDPLGATTHVVYKATPEYGSGATRKNKKIPFVLQTVGEIGVADGFGLTASTTFEYAGGDYYFNNAFDRKFAGFATTTATNGLGYITKTYTHQGNSTNSGEGEYSDDQSKIGKPYRTEIYDGSGNFYAKTINQWVNVDLGNDRDFVKRVQTVDFAYDGDGDHKDRAETYAHDNSTGNVTTRVEYGEVSGSDNGTFTDSGTDKFTTTITYAASTTLNLVGLPSQETVVNAASTTVKDTKFYYDSLSLGSVSNGNETKRELWKSGSSWIDIEKTYNGYGLVTQEKDPRDNATTYTYDSYNLHIATSTNAKSQLTGFVYDYSIGKPKRTNDPNGLIFQTTYDALDRVTTEEQPDLNNPGTLATKTVYTYTDTVGSRKVSEMHNLSGATSTLRYRYLDGLDRVIQERTEAEGTDYAVKDYTYNEIGKVEKESLPYFSSGTSRTTATTNGALYANFAYDPMARVTSIGTAVGTTTHAYDDWKQTITDPNGEVKHLYRDAYGNLNRVDEVNGAATYTTTYEYNYLKNLTKITDALSNVRNFTYDGLGRRLTAEDLHASGDATYGTWSFTYDAAGNLATSTDPKSQTIDYYYDVLNRVTSEDYTGAGSTEVTYSYDGCTYGIGRLCGATTTDSGTNYTYDPVGNVKTELRTIDGSPYTTTFTYDRQGNQTSITHPDGAIVAHNHNTAGLIESISRKESGESTYASVIDDIDYAPTGQMTYILYGNGVETSNTYGADELYRLQNTYTTAPSGIGGMGGFGAPQGKALLLPFAQAFLDLEAVVSEEATVTEGLPIPDTVGDVQSASTTEVPIHSETVDSESVVKEPTNVSITHAATESAAPTSPVMVTTPNTALATDGLIRNAHDARAWQKYHRERVAYLETRDDLPPRALEAAMQGQEKFADYLLEKGYTTTHGGEVRESIVSYLFNAAKRFFSWLLPEQAYAFLFGKEDFESCGSLPCSFDTNVSWGSVTASLDSGSQVSGTDSLKEVTSGEGGGGMETVNYNTNEIWVQFKIWVPDPTAWGASGYFTALMLEDSSNNSTIWLNVEDWATPHLTVNGDVLSYTDTNLDLVEGAVNTVEMRVKIGSSTGDIDIWLNNTTEGSPSYNGSGTMNTGTDNIDDVIAGLTYAPESGISTMYYDDIIVSDDFIGASASNTAPTAPTSLETEGQTNPTSITDPTPEFSAIYNDPDSGDVASYYQIRVSTESGTVCCRSCNLRRWNVARMSTRL